ncbi:MULTISPECIES: prepilin-type N-terminal cleavage/methylation domain-containing protein [unclassified Synechococcus]|uniref:type IV pilin protein n=1 Tax=unclassified Synechococcus TaxID=2626047 RepID=UPI001CF82E91|nr:MULTISPECIES: prepilin-type N-terminal cleavage/methylation domain-containing protein [unclassified Synechococcus]MCB4377283.1 prepilin-type N-terminal cleavage/methylation domain-containing protein [Synechococcus sp. MU1650]
MTSMFKKQPSSGFTLTEILIAVSIIGMLSGIAIPSYLNQACRSKSSEAIASIGSLQAIISAYIDETGVFPSNWDDLNSISAIMGQEGEMTGEFTKKWVLPSKYHEIMVSGPIDAAYSITAEPLSGCQNRSIKACLNSSTGASKLNKGDGATNAENVVCT